MRDIGRVRNIERTLILLRHAKSDWTGSLPDVDRPLADRGRRQATLAGRWLASRGAQIDRAIVSPARRARETWELVAAELADPPWARFDDRVYAASAGRLLDVVRELPDDARAVILVGHNPGMEALASRLAAEELTLRTSGIAEFSVFGPWAEADAAVATLRAAGRADGHGPG
jgi:phosphohistidine phosphatase